MLKNFEVLANNLYFIKIRLFFLLIVSDYHVTKNSRKIIVYKKISLYKNFSISFALEIYSTKSFYFSEIPCIARTIRKTSALVEFRLFERRRNVIVRSFIIQCQQPSPSVLSYYTFPYFSSSSACLPEDTAESRTKKDRRGANENNKEWFFSESTSQPPRSSRCGFQCCFMHDPTFSTFS